VTAVKKTHKESRVPVGSYRGFEVHALRHLRLSDAEGFRFALKGDGEKEFAPENLIYAFDDTISISGWFQRMDNFLDKGLDQSFQTYKGNVEQEIAELATVKSALGQEFGQKDELALTRENHAAVMRELKRMQDEPGYVSAWEPKTALPDSREIAHENANAIKKIAIIGSRTFNDYPMLESIVMGVMKDKGVKPSDVTIVSGGARGADALGREFAQKHSAQYLEFPADWEKFGKRAGFVRNADIVKNSDFVVALWDGQSRGTGNSLELAQQAGKPYFAYNFVTQKEAVLSEGNPPQVTLDMEQAAPVASIRMR
jgi:hypothetical protein